MGSKPPTSCNAILFKSNTVQKSTAPPLYPQLRAPLSGCDLKRNNTKVTQLHPSILGNSETSSKNATPKSKVRTGSTGLQQTATSPTTTVGQMVE